MQILISFANHYRASSRETRTTKGGLISNVGKRSGDGNTDISELFDEKSMLVPMPPHLDSKRSSRKGGSSRTASRSSSPGESIGIPDEDETDDGENNDGGNLISPYIGLIVLLQITFIIIRIFKSTPCSFRAPKEYRKTKKI